ncbi:thylakoid lumenal 16.5 kDa protein, chloroplastic [Malania oleifera]|uniref:thylakoid lumenal 16.5 kDa protein, chloroplastic n=1 Tax=Malania oleifera TaxID=397392 RepID=UPI0025AEB12D|nr:thylakoid lumenal 16.5 kDa protein, chloroplastic [Malania oleifera]
MAAPFPSTAKTILPSALSSSPSSSSSSASLPIYTRINNVKRLKILCHAMTEPPIMTKRSLSLCLTATFLFSLATKGFSNAKAAILEADDDEELMEKVKSDRKKRLQRQGVINSSKKETAYLQELIYKLSKVGQAIDNNDLSAAGSVLGASTNTDWVQNANKAFTKLSSSPEEKTEVDVFNSSLASLISSVVRNDVESSKIAFVSSAGAVEKWTILTGLVEQLKGL